MARIRRLLSSDTAGAAALEFALVAPVVLLAIFLIMQTADALSVRHALQYAADQGGRYAMITPGASDGDIETHTKGELIAVDPDTVTVVAQTVSPTPDSTFTTITLTHAYSLAFGGGDLTSLDLEAVARVPRID